MVLPKDREIAPCLGDGPLANPGSALVEAARALGNTLWASTLRAWCVPYLFTAMEEVFASGLAPAPALATAIDELVGFLRAAAAGRAGRFSPVAHPSSVGLTLEQFTGDHYGRLFRAFDADSFAEEPARLLRTRLERNVVELPPLATCRVLDAGCGGGRYSVAWRRLGAREVVGVDFSEPGIRDAARRIRELGIDGVTFVRGDVLDLPFPDASFDIVFSNGVLHHTRDWRRGIQNLLRVLRPGGVGWMYLIENPGGLFWDVIEILRVIMRDESPEHARLSLALVGTPPNRTFYMLDHVLVPINLRLTEEEIRLALHSAGATNIRRLARGADFDRIERIFQREPYAGEKYGVGEHRFVFTK